MPSIQWFMILNIVEHGWETDEHLQEHFSRQVTFESSTIDQLIEAVEKYVKDLDKRATVSWEWDIGGSGGDSGFWVTKILVSVTKDLYISHYQNE